MVEYDIVCLSGSVRIVLSGGSAGTTRIGPAPRYARTEHAHRRTLHESAHRTGSARRRLPISTSQESPPRGLARALGAKLSSSMPCFWKMPALMPTSASCWPRRRSADGHLSFSAADAAEDDDDLHDRCSTTATAPATWLVTPILLHRYRGGICKNSADLLLGHRAHGENIKLDRSAMMLYEIGRRSVCVDSFGSNSSDRFLQRIFVPALTFGAYIAIAFGSEYMQSAVSRWLSRSAGSHPSCSSAHRY